MQDYDLKNPGDNQQAQTLRRNTARALSIAHNEANPAKDLAEFLADAATKAPGYTKPAPDPLPSTQAIVDNGLKINLRNSSNTTTIGTPVTCFVANRALTQVVLPALTSAVTQGQVLTIGAQTFTFTVANGNITAIAVV